MLDAQEVLHRFMVDGLPDARHFEDTMKPIMDRTSGAGSVWSGRTVRWSTCCG